MVQIEKEIDRPLGQTSRPSGDGRAAWLRKGPLLAGLCVLAVVGSSAAIALRDKPFRVPEVAAVAKPEVAVAAQAPAQSPAKAAPAAARSPGGPAIIHVNPPAGESGRRGDPRSGGCRTGRPCRPSSRQGADRGQRQRSAADPGGRRPTAVRRLCPRLVGRARRAHRDRHRRAGRCRRPARRPRSASCRRRSRWPSRRRATALAAGCRRRGARATRSSCRCRSSRSTFPTSIPAATR